MQVMKPGENVAEVINQKATTQVLLRRAETAMGQDIWMLGQWPLATAWHVLKWKGVTWFACWLLITNVVFRQATA